MVNIDLLEGMLVHKVLSNLFQYKPIVPDITTDPQDISQPENLR